MSLNLKWTGVGSAISGSTPFGIYDNDTDFKNDGPKTAVWCAKRLGYPIVDVEMVDEQFYACFEESVSETALKEIKKDISTFVQDDGICIFMVNAGNNEYLMQFNIGAEKGDTSFENGIYFSDKEKLNQYFNKAKLISPFILIAFVIAISAFS